MTTTKTPKRVYQPAQTYTCENPRCARTFQAAPSDRIHAHSFCSLSCAVALTHQAQGHGPKQTYPCALAGCTNTVERYPSQRGRKDKAFENVYCCRAHYLQRKGDA